MVNNMNEEKIKSMALVWHEDGNPRMALEIETEEEVETCPHCGKPIKRIRKSGIKRARKKGIYRNRRHGESKRAT